MANELYEKARQKFGKGQLDLETQTIKVSLVDGADYTPNLVTDEFFSIIPGAGVIATATLANKTVDATGKFDADDATFTAVSGDQFELLIIWRDTGVASTSPLIAKIDTGGGLPFTPTGGNITITWGAYIFRLGPTP